MCGLVGKPWGSLSSGHVHLSAASTWVIGDRLGVALPRDCVLQL